MYTKRGRKTVSEEGLHSPLATKLREIRAGRALKLSDVEEMSGVTRETIGELERGKRIPYGATLQKLARAYGVSLAYLMADEQEGEEFELTPKGKAPRGSGHSESSASSAEQQPRSPAQRRLEAEAETFRRLIDGWERRLDERPTPTPTISRSILTSIQMAQEELVSAFMEGRWGSVSQLSEQEFARVKDEYEAERSVWLALEDRLDKIARKAIELVAASDEAEDAEVQALWTDQQEIHQENRRQMEQQLGA
jgi:transcriptional regulator with XRE-family HTH domain